MSKYCNGHADCPDKSDELSGCNGQYELIYLCCFPTNENHADTRMILVSECQNASAYYKCQLDIVHSCLHTGPSVEHAQMARATFELSL